MAEIVLERPTIQKVIDNQKKPSDELAFSFYVLRVCAHAYGMRQRNVLDDSDWTGRLQWMKNCFRKGTITEILKQVETEKWFNPDFQDFINREIVGGSL